MSAARPGLVVAALLGAILVTGCGGAHPAAHPAGPVTSSAAPDRSAAAAPVRARAAPMARSVPERLRIPAIGVDTALMPLGLTRSGALETPPGPFPAGYYTGAPTPGQLGPAVIAGHVRFDTPGVFRRLADLRPGDTVLVARRDGRTATFAVTRVRHVAKSRFPTRQVYGDLDHAGLRLITCGGLDPGTEEFEDNVVVFADLVTGTADATTTAPAPIPSPGA